AAETTRATCSGRPLPTPGRKTPGSGTAQRARPTIHGGQASSAHRTRRAHPQSSTSHEIKLAVRPHLLNWGLEAVLVDLAVLHHEDDLLQHADVLQRIAPDGDDVRVRA